MGEYIGKKSDVEQKKLSTKLVTVLKKLPNVSRQLRNAGNSSDPIMNSESF